MADDIVAQLEVLAEKLLIQWPEPDDPYNPRVVFDAIKEIERLRSENDEDEHLRERMADLLHRTAVALHGEPLAHGLHSWHDLPDLAERLRQALTDARSELAWLECQEARRG